MEQKVRIFEAFAGYGSQSLALERLRENFPEFGYEVVGISEIDKYAVQAYNAVHGETKNWGDVTAIDWHLVPDFDLLTWSSPCQDISSAGKGKGMTEGSGTRSSLLWEVKKPIEIKRPKYLLFENVKNFIGENNRADALRLFSMLEGYGYTIFYKVLNAKDYGVPQNRERIFILAKDGDASYEFPEGFLLERRLKDVLEDNVDERYYLSEKLIKYIFSNGGKKNNIKGAIGVQDGSNPSLCITSNYYKSPRQGNYIIESTDTTICINSKVNGKQPSVQDRIYDVEGCSTAITTAFRPNIAEPQVLTPKRTEYGKLVRKEYEAGNIKESRHNMTEMQPREDGISNTLTSVQKDNLVVEPFIKQYPRGFNDGFEHKAGYAPTITTSSFEHNNFVVEPSIKKLGNYSKSGHNASSIVDSEGIAPTVMENHGTDTAVLEKNGIIPFDDYNQRIPGNKDVIGTVTPQFGNSASRHGWKIIEPSFRIRKLTPRECFRLMDMDDKYIDRIQAAGISNTQQYKLAGNSIVVACLYWIFKNLFIGYEKTTLF